MYLDNSDSTFFQTVIIIIYCVIPLIFFYSLYLIIRYYWQRKQNYIHCPSCGEALPAHKENCNWKPHLQPTAAIVFVAISITACVVFCAVIFATIPQ